MNEEKLKEMAKPRNEEARHRTEEIVGLSRQQKIAREAMALATNACSDTKDRATVYNALLKMAKYADEHPKNPWRDAKKELPEEYEDVFVMTNTNTPTCGYLENGEFILDADYLTSKEVRYWMPIPRHRKEVRYESDIRIFTT